MISLILAVAISGQAKVGINMVGNAAYGTDRLWVDQMLTVNVNSGWLAWPLQDDPAGNPIKAQVDPANNPVEDASVSLYLEHAPTGVYTCHWSGSGTVSVTNAARATAGTVVVNDDGSSDLPVTIAGVHGIVQLIFAGVDPANPPTDVRFITPGYDPTSHPVVQTDAKRRYRVYDCIRMVDMMGVIGDTAAVWADRAKPTDFQGSGRVAYENVIAVANEIRPHRLWVNVPYHACCNADYQAQMARMFLQGLDPSIEIWVELSDELWNSGFEEGRANVADAATDPRLPSTLPAPQRADARHALNVACMGKAWRAQATALRMDPKRIKVLYGGQATNSWHVQTGLNFLVSQHIRPADVMDVVCVAAYAQMPSGTIMPGMTTDYVFTQLDNYMTTKIVPGLAAHAALARANGLAFGVYEWGQGLFDNVKGVTYDVHTPFSAAQSDPRMGTLMRSILSSIDGAGAILANHYSGVGRPSGIYGYWGLMESADASGSVKWDALLGRVLPPGDVDLSLQSDYGDYLAIVANVGKTGAFREDGDLTGDGTVDAADVAVWAASGPAVTDPQRDAALAAYPGITLIQRK